MDGLTVTRLRTECRLRRLPVSGRKRNLVLRLLPFADVILNGSRNTASKDVEAVADAGATHAVAGAMTMTPYQSKSQQPAESPAAELEFHRPFVPLDSFVSGWSNFDDDDWPKDDRSAAFVPRSSAIVRDELKRAYPLSVGSPVGDNPFPSIIGHDGFLTDADAADKPGTGDADGHPPLSDDGEPADQPSTPGQNETLVCRWLRQQRLIDELRRELCRYRRALATARLQTLARSSNDPASSLRQFSDVDHTTDDEISPTLSYFNAKRYTQTLHRLHTGRVAYLQLQIADRRPTCFHLHSSDFIAFHRLFLPSPSPSPAPRNTSVISRLRASTHFPRPTSRTKKVSIIHKYCSQ